MTFNKSLSINFVLFSLTAFLSLSILINWIVDANDVFHDVKLERFNKYKYKRTQNIVLYNATENISNFDTIIFGTSRSAIYGSNNQIFKNLKIINLSDIIYGYPSRIYGFLSELVRKQHNIKSIIIGLDVHTMTKPNTLKEDLRNKMFYKYPNLAYLLSKYYKLLPNNLPLSYETVRKNFEGKKPASHMDEFGVRYYHDELYKVTADLENNKKKFIFDNSELEYLSKIERLCENNGLKVSFFTFPYSSTYYHIDYEYAELEKLVELLPNFISGFYNFIFKNKLTEENKNYFNRSHHNHNFDNYIYEALILNNRSKVINDKYIYKYVTKREIHE